MTTRRQLRRQESARVLKEARAKRTPQQQLDRLITKGYGYCKEAKRLREQIAAAEVKQSKKQK